MKNETAIFAGGCFWCLDSIFRRIRGVKNVEVGYAGGNINNPKYEEVTTGKTGYAEAVKIYFDSSMISYGKLLEIFFAFHDPTTLNRQGNDVGTQYRSAIFYTNENQKESAENYISQIERDKIYSDPVVTETLALKRFYPAEDYHQDYFSKNPGNAYCSFFINPKLEKLRSTLRKILK